MKLAQALHGYDQGHGLLDSSGDVNRDERRVLDYLSDLSGYMPAGTMFDVYHTGYPCGRYYAFAATWYDHAASRPGCCLTHTLLIPRVEIGEVADLFALGHLHRKPASAKDIEPYQGTLETERPTAPPPMLPVSEMRTLAVLLFGTPSRETTLWEATEPTTDVARARWGLLEPQHRRLATFCTWAFGVRHLGEEPFAFLGVPRGARGNFRKVDAKRRPAGGGLIEYLGGADGQRAE